MEKQDAQSKSEMPRMTTSLIAQKGLDLDTEVKYLINKAKMAKAEKERERLKKEAAEKKAKEKEEKEKKKNKKKKKANQTEEATESGEDSEKEETTGKIVISKLLFFDFRGSLPN